MTENIVEMNSAIPAHFEGDADGCKAPDAPLFESKAFGQPGVTSEGGSGPAQLGEDEGNQYSGIVQPDWVDDKRRQK